MTINSETMIQFDYLEDLTAGDSAFMKTILVSIVDNMTEIIPQLKQEYRKQDYRELKRSAHKLKSSLVYLDLEAIDSILNTMENIQTKSDLETPEIKLALDNLELYQPILTKELEAKIATLN